MISCVMKVIKLNLQQLKNRWHVNPYIIYIQMRVYTWRVLSCRELKARGDYFLEDSEKSLVSGFNPPCCWHTWFLPNCTLVSSVAASRRFDMEKNFCKAGKSGRGYAWPLSSRYFRRRSQWRPLWPMSGIYSPKANVFSPNIDCLLQCAP